jgi:hypothetical protein
MNIIFNFHLNKRKESLISWEPLIISLENSNFLSDVWEGDSEKWVEFLKEDTELVENLTKLVKGNLAFLSNCLVYLGQALSDVSQIKPFLFHLKLSLETIIY